MKILVLAAGSVGSVLGARLAEAGHDVELVARPDHVAAMRADGLRVEGHRPGIFRVRAFDDLARADDPDLALLTAKTFDLVTVAGALGRRFPRLPPTLLPQNGLRIEVPVRAALVASGAADADRSLARAVTFLGAMLVRPGVVRQVGDGTLVFADPAKGGPAAAATRTFLELFAGTTVRAKVVPDLERELWRKALMNAAINPITALNGVTNGRLLEEPYRAAAVRLLREAQQAAAAAGYEIPNAEADGELDRVLRETAENRSSMLQDWERGRPTEVDAISGEILRVAEAHHIDLPETRAVIGRLHARGPSSTARAQPSYEAGPASGR